MSGETASVDGESQESTGTSVVDLWRKWYDMVGLAGIMVFMLWVRVQSWNRFVRDGQVLFSGNDAYYHFREISYAAENWPWTMPFDPWTAFPYGTSQGQFGTLYDQLVATAAMIVGLGDPSQNTVAMVALFAPAVLGALVAIPIYYAGRRAYNRATGLFAALLLAVMPGTFLRRSTVGFADHQVAEVFFMALAVLAIIVALSVAEAELPVYEQVLDRDWEGLKKPVTYSALAGLAVALYLWVWPPGVILVGILGVFFTVNLTADFLRGRSPDHVATVGVVSMAVFILVTLPLVQTFSFDTTVPSLLQIFVALAVLVWCAFLAALARFWSKSGVSDLGYPAAVGGLVVGGLLFLSVAIPSLYGTIVSNAFRSFGFGQSATTLTIAEAQPTPGVNPFQIGVLNEFLFTEYGLAYVVSLVSLAWLIAHTYLTDYRSENVFMIVFSVFMWLMALTQRRFHYYLVLAVVLTTAWSFGRIISITGAPSVTDRIGDIKPYQVLTILAIIMLVFAPLLPPLAAGSVAQSRSSGTPAFVMDAGKTRPSGTIWADTGEWMNASTPDPSAGSGLEYYGTYQKTDDFEYPESSYGVMAWWDYGHWITVLSQRIPHANPFQENARSASSFLQSRTEQRGNAILEAIPGNRDRLSRFDNMTTAEIEAAAADQSAQEDSEDIRYVMIDDQTAAGKFLAVRRWANPPGSNYFTSARYRIQQGRGPNAQSQNVTLGVPNSNFQDTLLYELYYENTENLSHYRLVHTSAQYSLVGGFIRQGRVRTLDSFRPRVWSNGWNQQLANTSRQLEALERRNTALSLGGNTFAYNASVESSLKVFERVPGATVSGRVEGVLNETPIVLELQLETGPGRPFTYYREATTDASGRFEVTVPYPTNQSVGPSEGGTDANVTAVGNYSLYVGAQKERIELFRQFGADLNQFVAEQFDVSEQAIYDGATVDLGEVQQPQTNNSNQSDGRLVGGERSAGGADWTGTDTGTDRTPSFPTLAAPRGN